MKDYKEGVRGALSRATDDRLLPQIAAELQIPPHRLHNFTSKGSLNTNDVHALAEWLAQHGYLETPAAHTPDWSAILAGQFEDMAKILRSDASQEFKSREFALRVRGWHAGLEEMARLLKKSKG